MKKETLTIKDLIKNMRDELNRADSVMTWLYEKHPEVYSEIQNSELGDVLSQDIRDDLDRTSDITERIDFAMLMSATVADVALPTIEEIYATEATIDLPYTEDDVVDTECVYNSLDEWCENINK